MKKLEQDILEFIKSRRSTRRYLDKPISKEQLDMVLEAGRYAPSGGNNQSWIRKMDCQSEHHFLELEMKLHIFKNKALDRKMETL